MKRSSLLLSFLLSSALYGETPPLDINLSAPAAHPAVTIAPQEMMISNKEPFNVNVINFPPDKIQKVKLDANDTIQVKLDKSDTINVMVSNPVKLVEKEKAKIISLNESTNVLNIESATLMGELHTDLQAIFIYKVAVKNKHGEQTGLKLHFIAEDKLEISKDIKILVENITYLDEEEVKKLQTALSKMLSIGNNPIENKDFKLSFKTTGDFELTLYTSKKMFSTARNIESSIIIGKEQKYPSKAIVSIKELTNLQTILGQYDSTPISPL